MISLWNGVSTPNRKKSRITESKIKAAHGRRGSTGRRRAGWGSIPKPLRTTAGSLLPSLELPWSHLQHWVQLHWSTRLEAQRNTRVSASAASRPVVRVRDGSRNCGEWSRGRCVPVGKRSLIKGCSCPYYFLLPFCARDSCSFIWPHFVVKDDFELFSLLSPPSTMAKGFCKHFLRGLRCVVRWPQVLQPPRCVAASFKLKHFP